MKREPRKKKRMNIGINMTVKTLGKCSICGLLFFCALSTTAETLTPEQTLESVKQSLVDFAMANEIQINSMAYLNNGVLHESAILSSQATYRGAPRLLGSVSKDAGSNKGITNSVQTFATQDAANKVKSKLQSGGWINAGWFYKDLTNIASVSGDIAGNFSRAMRTTNLSGSSGTLIDSANTLHRVASKILDREESGLSTDKKHLVRTGLDITRFCGIDSCEPSSILGSYALSLKQNIYHIVKEQSLFNKGEGKGNPMLAMGEIGSMFMNASATLMIAPVALDAIRGAAKGAGDSLSIPLVGGVLAAIFETLALVAERLSDWLGAGLMITFSFGFTLVYIVPMIPVALFIAGVMSWIIMLIESVAITPIWIAMMTVPEGEGISGQRLERGYSILLALVLRPTLMIIGLLSSIYVMFVVFELINQGFWGSMGAITQSAGNSLFGVIATVAIYIYLVLTMVKQSSQLIYSLPNNVLEWTGSVGRAFGDNEISGAMSNMGSGQAMNSLSGMATGGRVRGELGRESEGRNRSRADEFKVTGGK